jgi:hypothetical protein
MKTVRTILVLLFILLIIADIYGIAQYHVAFARRSIYLLILLIGLLCIPKRASWVIIILLSIYGIYNLIFVNFYAAEPTYMDITATLEYILRAHNFNSLLRGIVTGLPFYFYVFIFIILITNAGRRFFGISKRKEDVK